MATDALPMSAPSGKVLEPPLYHLASVGELQDGDHTHDCWHVRVAHEHIGGYTLPMIVKAVPSQITLAVEVACGLAARELRLNVPQPGLVVADREDLPGIADNIPGERLLLVGSHYQRPDALFAEAVANNPAADEMIWNAVCASAAAPQGAAWDELIANPDRHCENVLFDGTHWWLFDHDQALAPAAAYVRQEENTSVRDDAIAFNARSNQLVDELMRRHQGRGQVILEQTRRLESGRRRLHALATFSRQWTHKDDSVRHVLELIGIVLGLIHLRMPALAEKLRARLGIPPSSADLWTSREPNT